MTYSAISICSQALLKLGADSITSFEEGTAESEVAYNLYPLIRDSLLSSYPWSFAINQKKLPMLEEKPIADYEYAYLLPNDFLRVISTGTNGRGDGVQYTIVENRIHTNLDELTITYIFRPDESGYPAFFVDALVTKLAAELCIPLTEDATRAQHFLKRFDADIAKAKLIDARQVTPKKFEDFTLLEARG